ncbi:unnamed protein product [Lampetra planeri]
MPLSFSGELMATAADEDDDVIMTLTITMSQPDSALRADIASTAPAARHVNSTEQRPRDGAWPRLDLWPGR